MVSESDRSIHLLADLRTSPLLNLPKSAVVVSAPRSLASVMAYDSSLVGQMTISERVMSAFCGSILSRGPDWRFDSDISAGEIVAVAPPTDIFLTACISAGRYSKALFLIKT